MLRAIEEHAMISNIPQQGPAHPMMHERGANGPEMRPSAESTPAAGKASTPGQVAKTMIADATANGASLPANIQGKAASAIARGMNMETFFASFMPAVEPSADDIPADGESPPPDDAGDVAAAEPGSEIPAAESDATSLPSPASDGETTASPETAVARSYEIATSLLEPLVNPESGEVV